MSGILSIWRLALQRGKGGGDRQEATCFNHTGGSFVVDEQLLANILNSLTFCG